MSNKVLLIVVDGLRPDAVTDCKDPEFANFFKKGNYSFSAKTVFPPITLPCHMSLFHSTDPDRHGVNTNTYVPQNHPIPGLMEVLSSYDKKTAVFYMWEQLRDIWRPGNVSYTWFRSWEDYEWDRLDNEATAACERYIEEESPDFVFLYLDETDEYGHEYGWMSDEYKDCAERAWNCIKHISEKFLGDYHIIITADHGGHGRNHGDNVPEDMTIPVCIRGEGFDTAKELKDFSIKDIAPTIASIIGIPVNKRWEGRSVK